jgi:hypothetical protein|eukprot:CAMPEP_0174367454 /NCGR_PEP_ID=MMETSP0811_2-20130205/85363_1 /TAXON_ID=73025 ORGANISM="Eutreptiella gymnastica-like, Strain CCMP1594" /NCGR_SAMPLE_ID=MMETSP0811_2 /ASSEMBLY_ACC=CAM_ASM_000667 /LENGTH=69 /DNA_ID=CAMNT_0015510027 /DNA_START=251 /DNA_END=460 /DNA_ORIENTATION=-
MVEILTEGTCAWGIMDGHGQATCESSSLASLAGEWGSLLLYRRGGDLHRPGGAAEHQPMGYAPSFAWTV